MIATGLASAWYGVNIALAGRLRHASAAVTLASWERGIALHYHSLGGALDRRVVGGRVRHQAAFKAAGVRGALDLIAWLDTDQVHLPRRIDRYPSPALNRELYFWLAAFLAEDEPLPDEAEWPAGVRHLLRGVATAERVTAAFPALAARYRRLCAAELAQRARALPGWAGAATHPARRLESALRFALGDAPPKDDWLINALNAIRRGESPTGTCPFPPDQFLPFLPVPLWGHVHHTTGGLRFWLFRRKLRRRAHGERRALAQPRFDPEALGTASGDASQTRLSYPEWDHARKAYRSNWCAVHEEVPAPSRTELLEDSSALTQRVRRQFEALRQLPAWQRRRDSGEEIDLDAYVDAASDARGCGHRSARVYRQRARSWRDLSVAVLLDASRSTEAWVGTQRVIDIERAALLSLGGTLAAVGDDFGLYAFASESRKHVRCFLIKDFDQPYGEGARRRLAALTPAGYTRMGAAIRHVGARLARRRAAERLLLVLTDGRPHDPPDGYEGRYAIEDTRRALLEQRARGLHVFGLTIDDRGREYLPRLFGPGRYAVLSHAQRLPLVLPQLYARLTLAP